MPKQRCSKVMEITRWHAANHPIRLAHLRIRRHFPRHAWASLILMIGRRREIGILLIANQLHFGDGARRRRTLDNQIHQKAVGRR